MGKLLVVGNWKMNRMPSEAEPFLRQLREQMPAMQHVTVVVCPPFPSLPIAAPVLEKSPIQLGAQNMCWARGGAFTGEVSPAMLRDLYVTHVILGHSERRSHFHETLEQIAAKVRAALDNGLIPILCLGETQAEREAARQSSVVERQLISALEGLGEEQARRLVVAYEPIWAIGTGKTATPDQAQEMHATLRQLLAKHLGEETARRVRILYGGSVQAANALELFRQPDIDGGLVGGASLDANEFLAIVAHAHSCA
ncbi:MAG: triose-phosphate isomerase [Puniceicoccales bacterium]|jgi:triosephosphate isomerase|nr:triose-phosphate isomerase [Puniceicoccales bacterium]